MNQKSQEHLFAERVRFWDDLNDDAVKITLKAGQSVSRTVERVTEEGYDDLEVTISFDGYTITRVTHRRALDCDGPLSQTLRQTATGLWRDSQGQRWADYGVAQ